MGFTPFIMVSPSIAVLFLQLIMKRKNDFLDSLGTSQLRHVLGSIAQGVLVADENKKLLCANVGFEKITGYDTSEVIGRSCDFLQGPDTDPASIVQLRTALDAREQVSVEILNYRKNGDAFWNQLTISPIFDEMGQATHFIALLTDVTERKKAEAEILAGDVLLLKLIENIPAGVVIHGPHSEIQMANNSAAQMLGLSMEQMMGRVAIDPEWHFIDQYGNVMPVEDYPVNQVLRSKEPVRGIVAGVHKQDSSDVTWVLCNAFPVLSDTGAIERIVVSFADVTDLKTAEAALRRSEERLSLVLKGSRDAPWDWDLTSDELYLSPRWWQILGYEDYPVRSKASIWIDYIHPDDRERFIKDLVGYLKTGVESYEVELRIRHKDGHYVPILSRAFILRDASGWAIRISGTNSDLTERKQAEERINRLAFYDALTGLPNRRLFMAQLQKALQKSMRSPEHGALLFIDLDNFKSLNDTLGHDKGDDLLQQVAKRLQRCVRDSDTVARLGGDEFLVMLEGLNENKANAFQEAEQIGKKILANLNLPYDLAGHHFRSTCSIGIAMFARQMPSMDDLLKQADLAMYQAKTSGRNALRFFDTGMQIALDHRVEIEAQLRDAIHQKQLVLYYQPQVCNVGHIIGTEALVRWLHPTHGLIAPAKFIAIAESTGMILPLGRLVLRMACEQLAKWAKNPETAKLTIAVNISAQQFREADFADQVMSIVHETGANPQLLKLELRESLLADNLEQIIETMSELRSQGVRFALDDFGTGYSSLNYLKNLPLDQLKIDQSFISDVLDGTNNATVTKVVISLAETLGLDVIAEGVETESQRQFLLDNGCRQFQGYLFSQALTIDAFEEVINR